MADPTFRSRVEAHLRESQAARRTVEPVERTTANVVSRVVPAHVMKNKRLFDVWERRGYHVVPAHFYEPLPRRGRLERALDGARRSRRRPRTRARPQLLAELQEWKDEYDAFPRTAAESPDGFYVENSLFGSVDAEVLYALVRRFRPKRRLRDRIRLLDSRRRPRVARERGGRPERRPSSSPSSRIRPTCSAGVSRASPGSTNGASRTSRSRRSTSSSASDILFIDSSHVVATGSDVCIELLDIVPAARAGCDRPRPRRVPARRVSAEVAPTRPLLLDGAISAAGVPRLQRRVRGPVGRPLHASRAIPAALREAFASYARKPASPGSFWFRRVTAMTPSNSSASRRVSLRRS